MTVAHRGSRYARKSGSRKRRLEAQRFWRQAPGMEILESRTLLSSLTTIIQNALESGTVSGTLSPGNADLGPLTIDSPTLSFNYLTHDSSGWSGSVSVDATTASLALNPTGALSLAIKNGLHGQYTLSDQTDGDGSFALTAGQVTADITTAITATASSVAIGYDPAAAGSELNIDIAGASATINPFHDATVTLKDLNTSDTGFTLADATLSAGDINLGGFIALDGASVDVSGISETNGAAVLGTITLSATSVSMFPGAPSKLQASLNNFKGTYTMGDTSATLSADSASLSVGDIFTATLTDPQFTASANLSSSTLSSSSVSLSSPQLPGLTGSLTSLQIGSGGFSIAQADVKGSASSARCWMSRPPPCRWPTSAIASAAAPARSATARSS